MPPSQNQPALRGGRGSRRSGGATATPWWTRRTMPELRLRCVYPPLQNTKPASEKAPSMGAVRVAPPLHQMEIAMPAMRRGKTKMPCLHNLRGWVPVLIAPRASRRATAATNRR